MTSVLKINLLLILTITTFSTYSFSSEKWCHFITQKSFEGLITISNGLKNNASCQCTESFVHLFDENLVFYYKSPGDLLDTMEGESSDIKEKAQKFFPSKNAKSHLALYIEKFKVAAEVLDKDNKIFGLNIHVWLTSKYAKQAGIDKDRQMEFVFSKSESSCKSLIDETLARYKKINEQKKSKKYDKYK